MKITKRKINIEQEKKILVNLITDTNYLKQIMPTIQKETLELAWANKIVYWVKSYFEKYQEAPKDYIQDIYVSEIANVDEAEAKLIGSFLEDLSDEYVESENKNTKYHVDSTLPYIVSRNYVTLADKIKANAGLGKNQECERLLVSHKDTVSISSGCVNPNDEEFIKHAFQASKDDILFELPGAVGEMIKIERGRLIAFLGSPKKGKCHGKGTKILMHDGSIKKVEDIIVGDKIMGPDSNPRNILSLGRGREEMYKVTLVNGDFYTCNKSHIMHIYNASQKKYTNMSVGEYIDNSNRFKEKSRHLKAIIDWNKNNNLEISPYLFGCWLGDGHVGRLAFTINDKDVEIVNEINIFAKEKNLNIRVVDGRNCHSYFLVRKVKGSAKHCDAFYYLKNIGENKHIPQEYLLNSRENRLQLLAGLLDTDGYYSSEKNVLSYQIITKFEALKNDILFLVKSLGFRASSRNKIVNGKIYHDIRISFNIHLIPCKTRKKAEEKIHHKALDKYSFKVEPIGVDDYYGFEIDGDHLYVLGDFTITHNTFIQHEIGVHARKAGLKVFECNLEMSVEKMFMRDIKRISGETTKEGFVLFPVADCYKNQTGLCQKKERSSSVHLLNVDGMKPEFVNADEKYVPCTACRGTTDFKIDTWFISEYKDGISLEKALRVNNSWKVMYGANNYRLKCYPKFSASVNDIIADLNMLEYTEGFVPDVIICDYADILKPISNMELRHQLDETWKMLGRLATEKNCALITASQTNRIGASKKNIKGTDIAEAFVKTAHVDSLIFMHQTDTEKKFGILRLSLGYNRDGEASEYKQVMLLQNLATANPLLDSEWIESKKED